MFTDMVVNVAESGVEAEKGVEDHGVWQETTTNALKLGSVKKRFDLDTHLLSQHSERLKQEDGEF